MSNIDWSGYEIFPEPFLNVINSISRATQTPFEMPMMGLLAMTAACIGKTRYLEVKPGYLVTPNLYLALVAKSGSGKSPAVDPFMMALTSQSSNKGLNLRITDATLPGLRDSMLESSRGIILHRDELSGLFADLNKNPNFAAKVTESYEIKDWNFVKHNDSTTIKDACLSVFGTVQPELIDSLFKVGNCSSGLLTRFLFSTVPSMPLQQWSWQGVDEEVVDYLNKFAAYLLTLQLDHNGKPQTINLSSTAAAFYADWVNASCLNVARSMDVGAWQGLVRKIQNQVLRLAVNLHFMEQFALGSDSDLVSPETMHRAIFLGEYFLSEHIKTRLCASSSASKERTEVQLDLLEAVVGARHKVVDGMLATADISDAFNDGKSKKDHKNEKSIGRSIKFMGFKPCKLPCGRRGRKITCNDIDRIAGELAEVANVFGI